MRLRQDHSDGRSHHVLLVCSKLRIKSRGRGGCVHGRPLRGRAYQYRARSAFHFHVRDGNSGRGHCNGCEPVREPHDLVYLIFARQKHCASAPEVRQPPCARLWADHRRGLSDHRPSGHGEPCLGAHEHSGRDLRRRGRRGAHDLQQDIPPRPQRYDRHRTGLPARRGLQLRRRRPQAHPRGLSLCNEARNRHLHSGRGDHCRLCRQHHRLVP